MRITMIRKSIQLRKELRDSISEEIAERTKRHQSKVAAFKIGHAHIQTLGAAPPFGAPDHACSW